MNPYVIISADCHAELPTEQYREYVDPEYREDFEAYLAEKAAASQAGGFIDEQFAEQWFSEHGDGIAGGWDVALRDKELDGDGVVGEVIFPDADAVTGVAGAPFGAGLGQSGDLDPGRAMAGARAHNRWLAELCSHSPERRAGVAVVPILADIDAAVAEITRAAESGLRGGILIPARWVGYPPYHDRRYDKVWAACQDLQMPVHTPPARSAGGVRRAPGHLCNRGALVGSPAPVVRVVVRRVRALPPAALGRHGMRCVLGQRPALADGHAVPARSIRPRR